MPTDTERQQALDAAAKVTRETTATPDEVWQVLGDGWRYPGWVVGASRMRAVEPSWPAAGTRLHHSVGGWPALVDDETVSLAADAPHRLRLQAKVRPAGEAVVEVQVEETDAGSRLTMAEDVVAGPMLLVPRPLRQLAVMPRNIEALRRLVLLAEQADHPDGGISPRR